MSGCNVDEKGEKKYNYRFYVYLLGLYFALEINWVIVPIGQYTHQDLGLYKIIVITPNIVKVSIML